MTMQGPGPGIPVTELRPDAGCFNFLNWRCDLYKEVPAAKMEEELVGRGFESRSSHPNLRVFRNDRGHEISWIPSTGRIRLRVDYLIEHDAREGEARKLYDELLAVIRAIRR